MVLALFAILVLLTGCNPEGAPNGAQATAGARAFPVLKRDVTFHADGLGNYWFNVTIFVGGDPKGPYEKRESFERTIKGIPVGTEVTLQLILGRGQQPPGPIVHCHIRIGTQPLKDEDGRGGCRITTVVPAPATQA